MKFHLVLPFLQKSPLAPRYWGDETGPGGVWGIYLKKVRYHPSSSYTNGENDDTVSHLEWETIKVRNLLVESLVFLCPHQSAPWKYTGLPSRTR